MNKKLIKNNFRTWCNDGGNKFKKALDIFVIWWDDGNSKFLKAIYFSLFIHFLFGFFWLINIGLGFIL